MKYILLIGAIINIGGGQSYCSNKVAELEKRGFKVFVISSEYGKIYIKNLKKFEKYIIPEIDYKPRYFSEKKCRKIIDRLIGFIDWNEGDKCLVDSAHIAQAEWGELLAQKVGAKHICHVIDEVFDVRKEDVDFLLYKLKRQELYGTSTKSLPILFSGYYVVKSEERYSFNPYCTNVVEDVECELIHRLSPDAVKIGYFGRLGKPYIKQSLEKSMPFFDKFANKEFNVILIGGTSDSCVEKSIRKLVEQRENIQLYVTGILYPVPRTLLKCLDVCIASAGCAMVAYEEGVLTVNVGALTGEAVGILGKTFFPEEDGRYADANYDLADLLEEILLDKERILSEIVHSNCETFESGLKKEIDSQLENFKNESGGYFEIHTIKSNSMKHKICKLAIRLFGLDLYKKMIKLLMKCVPEPIKKICCTKVSGG